jgi:hypothetical protein
MWMTQMMHEFLCSENPLVPLAMSDMETSMGERVTD